MRLDPAPLCLRNDGGTLRFLFDEYTYELMECDVCGDKYTVELLERAIKSTWEALRLGYHPYELRPFGMVRLSLIWGTERGEFTNGPMVYESRECDTVQWVKTRA